MDDYRPGHCDKHLGYFAGCADCLEAVDRPSLIRIRQTAGSCEYCGRLHATADCTHIVEPEVTRLLAAG